MEQQASEHQPHINIHVNRVHVVMASDDASGSEIKAAAIAQGVDIKADFVLSALCNDGKWDTIGDNDTVELRDGEQFAAVAPEEHS